MFIFIFLSEHLNTKYNYLLSLAKNRCSMKNFFNKLLGECLEGNNVPKETAITLNVRFIPFTIK